MKKIIFIAAFTMLFHQAFAQDKPAKKWDNSGVFNFLFNQSAFNNDWIGGGTSNYGGNVGINYDWKYANERATWNTKFIGEYGITQAKDQKFSRKTNDRLELNSVYGYRVTTDSSWSYSAFVNLLTQFDRGFAFSNDPITGEELRTETTRILSPGFLQIGPGLLYKKGENFNVNIAPATTRFIIVDKRFTSAPDYVDGAYFGVDRGKGLRTEFGASINALYKTQLAENIVMDNMLLLYANYLENPENVDINYSTNVNMKINKWLSTNFIFQAIYDDNAVGAFQIRQVFGLGLNYKIVPK